MAVHGHPTHNSAALDLMNGHQGAQRVLREPLLIWHLDSNQVQIKVYSLHIRITQGVRDVALNGHQCRRVHGDNGLTT